MNIRNMTKADAEDVARLFVATDPKVFPSLFSPFGSFVRYVRNTCKAGGFLSTDSVRVAEEDGEVLGICVTYSDIPKPIGCGPAGEPSLGEKFDDAIASQAEDAEMAISQGMSYLDCLSVDERHRRKGTGRALVADAQGRHGSLMLLCRTDNKTASSLYRDAGFRPVGMMFGLSEDGTEMGPAMTVFAWER